MTSIVASWGIYSKPSGGIGMAVQPVPSPPSADAAGAAEDKLSMMAPDDVDGPQQPISAPLYASASNPNLAGEMLDLTDIFSDDFLMGDQGSLGDSFDGDQGGIMLGESDLDALPGPHNPPSSSTAAASSAPARSPRASVKHEVDDNSDDEDYSREGAGTTSRRRKKAKLTLKPLTEAQRIERRERNREHAKRSRMRKKFMLESLQAQMTALRKENLKLRQAVTMKMPEKADDILKTCGASPKTTAALSAVELGHHKALADSDGKLIKCLQFSQQNFTVSDPSLPDNPIVYASEGFIKLTGYSRDQILGRNCRFLQGPGTDPDAVDIIRRAIALGEDASVCLLNYRADGTPFWNQFFVAALRDERGNIVNYVGVQCEVAQGSMEEELKERVKSLNWDDEH